MSDISILLPTRKRFDLMLNSIRSLYQKAKHPSDIELMIWLDDDDLESIQRQDEIKEITENYKIFVGDRERGYADLHLFVNKLCKESTGEFLMLWNDDATMTTEYWDVEIMNYWGETKLLLLNSNHKECHWAFPVLSRDIYDAIGHFSLNCHNDTWIYRVCSALQLDTFLPSIQVFHDRADMTGNNRDSTYLEGSGFGNVKYSETGKVFESLEMCYQRIEDCKKIIEYLGNDSKLTLNFKYIIQEVES
jgi:hypothetical protein